MLNTLHTSPLPINKPQEKLKLQKLALNALDGGLPKILIYQTPTHQPLNGI